MPYLIPNDYLRIIQPTELNSITSNQPSIRVLMEGTVEKEIRSYLIQKYDLTTEFKDTQLFSMTTIYKGGERVYLDASAYDATKTYAVGALVLQGGIVYACKTAIVAPEVFTIAKWDALGNQYALFYITYPSPVFEQNTFYKRGTQVWWADKTYTAQTDSPLSSHELQIQAIEINRIAVGNITPNNQNTSVAQAMWGTGVAYQVAAGTLPTDTSKWTAGDNRNQFFVALYMDMVVYELSKRIAPNNVPIARHNAWLRAIDVLKSFAKGDITAELPQLQPKQGNPIRYGGKVPKEYNGI